jgi:hypothetical protein
MRKSIINRTHSIKNPINENQFCFRTIIINNKKYEVRRLCLPLISLTCLLGIHALYNFVYLPLVIFMISFILFWNFPTMVTFTNTKPLYYEDLFIDTSKIHLLDVSPAKKVYFENLFHWMLIVSNSVFMAALSDYWLYKTFMKESFMEIVGVTGGILKIFQLINHITGSALLQFTRQLIQKEYTTKQIEMKMLTNTTHTIVECPLSILKRQHSIRSKHPRFALQSRHCSDNISIEIIEINQDSGNSVY